MNAIAAQYQLFAREEARGRSADYEALAEAAAGDPAVLAFLAELPQPKQQPNLLFAAARWLLDAPATPAALHDLATERAGELAAVMLARYTQTNEPARCAILLPALAQLPPPLALIEVGASAGLTLLHDRYSYDYGGHRITGTDPDAPVLACQPHGPVPLPDAVPEIVWRAGLDLNPLDVHDDGDMRWLRSLLWPGESGRAERLAQAIVVARRDPPPLHRADLRTGLPALAAQAPPEATLVVLHTSVLYQVDEAGRRGFAATVRELGATWLSNESPGLVPGVVTAPVDGSALVLIKDGATALARSESHGTWVRWLD